MATKKTKKVEEPVSALVLSQQLEDVRTKAAELKTLNDKLTKAFKAALENEGINEAGNYRLERSTSFKVSVEELALPFALQRNLVKIDTAKVHEVFRLDADLRFKDPEQFGFAVVDTVRVAPIRGGKDDE